MKIAWFTPFTSTSAIGQFSQRATEELVKIGVSTEIFTGCSKDLLTSACPVHKIDFKTILSKLKQYDHVVYNIGDYNLFHKDIISVAFQHPGIVVQHDVSIFNLVVGSVDNFAFLDNEILGTTDIQKVFRYASESTFLSLFNFIATDIVCHSNFAFRQSERYCEAPVHQLYLPNYYDKLDISKIIDAPDFAEQTSYFLSLGNVNQNRRIHDIIEALHIIGKPRLKNTKFMVAGSLSAIEYTNQLKALIEKYELQDVVILLGSVSNDSLMRYLKKASFCINLRNPALEGASASAILQMYFEKAVIVSDTGVYQELSDDTVFKIPPGDEVAGLVELIPQLLDNPHLTRERGRLAAKYVEDCLSVAAYASRFKQILSNEAKPVSRSRYLGAAHEIEKRDLPFQSHEAEVLSEKLAEFLPKNNSKLTSHSILQCLFAFNHWKDRDFIPKSIFKIRFYIFKFLFQIVFGKITRQPRYVVLGKPKLLKYYHLLTDAEKRFASCLLNLAKKSRQL